MALQWWFSKLPKKSPNIWATLERKTSQNRPIWSHCLWPRLLVSAINRQTEKLLSGRSSCDDTTIFSYFSVFSNFKIMTTTTTLSSLTPFGRKRKKCVFVFCPTFYPVLFFSVLRQKLFQYLCRQVWWCFTTNVLYQTSSQFTTTATTTITATMLQIT